MGHPKMPPIPPAPVDPAIDPKAQINADEAARRAKSRQQAGTAAAGTILTSGLGAPEELSVKRTSLG